MSDEEYTYKYKYYSTENDEVIPSVNYDTSIAAEHLRDKMREENTSGKMRRRVLEELAKGNGGVHNSKVVDIEDHEWFLTDLPGE